MLVTDPRFNYLDPRIQTQVTTDYDNSSGSVAGARIGGPWTGSEADAYLDAVVANAPIDPGNISQHGNYVIQGRNAIAVERAKAALPPGVPGSTAVAVPPPPMPKAPAPPPVPAAPPVPTPAAPAAPAASNPPVAPMLPSSVQGLHNSWASDPRAAFLFQGAQPSTPGQTAPAPTPSANNAHSRTINAIDRAGSSLGLITTADLDEANDIALSRYAAEWNAMVAAGKDPATLTTTPLGKWLYVVRSLALADIYDQMHLDQRTDVKVPDPLQAALKPNPPKGSVPSSYAYYVTAAKKVRQQNLKAPLVRIGRPSGGPLGAGAPTLVPRSIQPAPVPTTNSVATAPKPGQWPTPTAPVDFGGVEAQLHSMSPLKTTGGDIDWSAQRARRQKWIDSVPGPSVTQRKHLADAADRILNHGGQGIAGAGPSGGFEGIREAAHSLAKRQYHYLNSQTYKQGTMTTQDFDDARILMQAAAQSDFVPDRDGSGEHKMYRGLVLNPTDLAEYRQGRIMTEVLGQYTTQEEYARGYMTLRGRNGTMHVAGRDENVLLEVVDAHGIPITPLAYTSRTNNHGQSDEIVSSGQFEVVSVTTSNDPVVTLQHSGGVRRSGTTEKVTHVRLKQISPGWDFAGGQVTLLGEDKVAAPVVQVDPNAVAPGSSLSTPGTGPIITAHGLGRARRVITPPNKVGVKATKAKTKVPQTSATTRGLSLTPGAFPTTPTTLIPSTTPGPDLTAMASRRVPVRGATPIPSTFPNVDAYWTYGGRVAPGTAPANEVMAELVNMLNTTPASAAVNRLGREFGINIATDLGNGLTTDEDIAFLATMLKGYQDGDTWDVARDKAVDAAYTAASHLNSETITPARNRPSPIQNDADRKWIDGLMQKDALVGALFTQQYLLSHSGSTGAPPIQSAYDRAGTTTDALEVSGKITPAKAKELRNYLGAGLPKPTGPATAGANLAPSGLHLRRTYTTPSVFSPPPSIPAPPPMSISKPNIAKGSGSAPVVSRTIPWDTDLLSPAAAAAGLPQSADLAQATWNSMGGGERQSIEKHFGAYSWRYIGSNTNPQQIAEMTAIMNAYIVARARYNNEFLTGSQTTSGRNLAAKAEIAERARIVPIITAIKAQALAAKGITAPLPPPPGRPARSRYELLGDIMNPRPDPNPNVMRGSRYEFGDYLGFVRDPVVQEQIAVGRWGDGDPVVDAAGMSKYFRTAPAYKTTGQPHGDKVMMLLATVQGYTDAPDVVTEDEMDEYVRNGEWVLYRGVQQAAHFNNGRDGTFSMSSRSHGGGIMNGRGTYWSSPEQGGTAGTVAANRDSAYQVATGFGQFVFRATMRPDAHVARRQDFVNMVNIVRNDSSLTSEEKRFLIGNLATQPQAPPYKVTSSDINFDLRGSGTGLDPAILATAFGFDAYFSVEPTQGADHLTVLNRTALRVQINPAKRPTW